MNKQLQCRAIKNFNYIFIHGFTKSKKQDLDRIVQNVYAIGTKMLKPLIGSYLLDCNARLKKTKKPNYE